MAAYCALGLVRARRLAHAADVACAHVARGAAGIAHVVHPADPRAAPAAGPGARRRRTCCGCSRARRSSSRTAGATRCRTRTRCAARRRCTARRATSSTTSTTPISVELNAATDNPLVLVEEDALVSNGNFHGQPLAFALDVMAMAVAELANISERRVERLVNPNLSDGLPAFLTTRRRAEQRVHDSAVRGRVARLREQGARASGVGGLDPDERRAGGSRVDGERRGAEGVAGARELRARARDRAARRRAGRRVPRAARARASACARRAQFVRELLAAAEGRPLARARHRGGRGRRSATARCRRDEAASDELHERPTLARVEALCGDLSRIRAPRGTELNARQWSTEAPLRMLLNNLDREVAEKPEELDRLRRLGQGGAQPRRAARDRRDAARARPRRDAARAVGQAGRRLHDARGRAARAHRELAARPEVGDVGRVPPARGGGPDDVRADDRGLVDLHRHAGDPPGDVPDVRGGGGEALRRARSRAAARSSPPGSAAWAARSRSPGRWPAPRSSASRSTRSASSGGWRRAISTRRPTRSTTRSRASARRRRRGARCRSACSATPPTSFPQLAARGEHFDLVTDQTAAHDPLNGLHADRATRSQEADALRASDPDEYLRRRARVDRRARRGDARVRPARCVCFRLWQQPSR